MFNKSNQDSDTPTKGKQITFYGAPWCAPCNQLKRQLEDEGISFDFRSVDDKDNEQVMLEASDGRYLIPTVIIGKRVLQNPPLAMVKDALK